MKTTRHRNDMIIFFIFLFALNENQAIEGQRKNERLPSSNEVEKKDKWVRRNVHFPENDDVEQISKEQDDDVDDEDENDDEDDDDDDIDKSDLDEI